LAQLWVSFASDTEDNQPSYVPGWQSIGSNYDANPSILSWSWCKYWPDLSECFKSKDVPVSWLIRTDDGPVRDHMLSLFRDEILELRSNGDEIGIHIHTFAWNRELSRWTQTTNPKNQTRIVLRSLDMFKEKLGFAPSCTRMGWNTMSNEIMKTLEANGILADSSAIPGTCSLGKFGKRDNIYDWSRAPNRPYHPSHEDYQKPGNMNILEIPISTHETSKPTLLTSLTNKLSATRGSSLLLELVPLARMFNINPNYGFYVSPWWSLTPAIRTIKAYQTKALQDGIAYLVGFFHGHDILNPKTGEKNLIFEKYLSRIIKEILSLHGIEITFATLSEIAKKYERDENSIHF